MATSTADMKTSLMQEDADSRHIVEKHRELDRQIEDAAQQIRLTTERETETVTLKKKKLHLKDLIGARLAEFSHHQG